MAEPHVTKTSHFIWMPMAAGCLAACALGAWSGSATGNLLAGLTIAGLGIATVLLLFKVKLLTTRLRNLQRQIDAPPAPAPAQAAALEELIRSEQEQRKLAERLRTAMNTAGISMWEWNIKSDRCRVMEGSAFIERMGGRNEYQGREYPNEIVHPDDRAGWVPMWTDFIRRPPGGDDLLARRYRAIYPDGSIHWIQLHARLLRTPEGVPRTVLGVDWDITKEIAAAEEIAKQAQKIADGEARLLRAVGGTRDALFDLHIDHSKSWISPHFYPLLGYDENEFELTNEWWNSLIHPDDQERRIKVGKAHLERGEPFDVEYRLRKKNGEWLWVRARGLASPERDASGRPLRFSGALQDIAEERLTRERLMRATEAAEEASRAKSAFLATMSHEIRTPMNGIIGMATLLLDSQLNGVQRDYAETVLSSADSLLKILNDILDFSKIEAGKLEIEKIDMDLTATVEDIASLMSFQCAAKNLEMVVNIRPNTPAWVLGDPQRLRQCLLNLVGNAIKFTHHGEVTIDVFPVGGQNGKTLVQFEVRDTGVGIEPDVLTTLFRPFTQADSSTTRRFGGTGLGLSIVRRLVELMGGQVGAESEPGKGSMFWFTLPLEELGTHDDAQATETSQGAHSVLLVDDNETNRRVLAGQLRQAGYEVQVASSGQDALRVLREREHLPFDLVLLDFEMPEMDGAMLGERIMADAAMSRSRLVMLTSLDRAGDMQRFAEIGFAAYLPKPVRNRELLRCLRKVLGYEANAWQSRSQPMVTRGNLLTSDGCAYQGTVLLVEDNPINQRVARRFLERLGCTVELADDGLKAIAAFEAGQFAMILMDMQMPVMDGLESTRRIRAIEKRKRMTRTPIVALTANAMAGQMELCLDAGMDDYLTKPLEIERLHAALDRYLGGSRPAPAPQAATAEGDTDAVVVERLREVADGDMEFARELVEAYVTSGTSIIAELRGAAGRSDYKALAQAAHKLKGASANMHLSHLATLAHNLEMRGKQAPDPQHGWAAEIDALAVELQRVQAVLLNAVQTPVRRSA